MKVLDRIASFGWVKFYLITILISCIFIGLPFGAAFGATVFLFCVVAFILTFGLSTIITAITK